MAAWEQERNDRGFPGSLDLPAWSFDVIEPMIQATSFPASLSREVVEAVEAEQRRLAQVLHDSVCQGLGAAELIAELLLRQLQRALPEAVEKAGSLQTILRGAADELHALARTLKPPGAPEGLEIALARLGEVACLRPLPAIAAADERQLWQMARQFVSAFAGARAAISLRTRGRQLQLRVSVTWGELRSAGRLPPGEVRLLQHRAQAIGATLKLSGPRAETPTMICRYPLSA